MNVDTARKLWHIKLTRSVVESWCNKLMQQERWHEWERRERAAKRAVYGMLKIAALSRRLHSAGLSSSSLSCLTSLLKPRAAVRINPPLPTTGLPPRPSCSVRISAAFHPSTLPQTPSVFLPPPSDTHIHAAEGLIVPGGRTPSIRVKGREGVKA